MCPCTLVDRKRKRFINAVDVVVRLHDPTDHSTEGTTPLSLAHVKLDELLIQQRVEGEFHQHDDVVTVMVMLSTQGFA